MNILQQYADKQVHTAIALLNKYVATTDMETLHQLRVSLKKLKAVLQYLRSAKVSKTKKSKQSLQLLFHAAGAVRELQLRRQWLLLNKYEALIAAAQLQHKKREEENWFIERSEDWRAILKKLKTKLHQLTAGADHARLLKYSMALKEEIGQFSFTGATDLHAFRKQVKQLLYAQHWFTDTEKLKLLPVKESKRLDALQEQIGNWHDLVDLFNWLQEQQFYLSKDKLLHTAYTNAANKIRLQQKKAEQLLQKNTGLTKMPLHKQGH